MKTVLAVRKWKRVKKKRKWTVFLLPPMFLCMRGKLNIFAFMHKTFVIQVSLLRKFKIRTLRELNVFNFLESSTGFIYQIYFFEPKSANSFKFISSRAWKCFILKLLLYILYLFLYLHEAGQVTYLLEKQENIHPENWYKFRNGNGLFLLSACNTQRFSQANQTASERQSCVRTGS